MQPNTLTLHYRPRQSLSAHPDNPRKHSPRQIKQIAKSIQTFGFRVPVLINQQSEIVAGHGRVLACEHIGIDSIPVIELSDLTDAQIRALMIADNKLTENAEWDEARLAQNFKVLSDLELDFDLDVSGFDYGHIEELVMSIEGEVPDARNDKMNESEFIDVSQQIVTQSGDLWKLGQHQIYCGDALDKAVYKRLLGQKKAALVFTDPPYNLPAKTIGKVANQTHGDFHQAAGEMSRDEFTDFLNSLFSQLVNYTKKGSIHYVCMDWRHLTEVLSAGNQHYHELKNICVWNKDRAGTGSFYRSQHEMVLVFKNGSQQHQNHFKLGENGRYRSNVWSYPSVRSFSSNDDDINSQEALSLHPTMKPVGLVQDALLDCSKRGDIVLDAFLGSGTTLLAAEKSHRICIGIEIEPKYVDVAIKRWQLITNQDAIHGESGKTFNALSEELLDE